MLSLIAMPQLIVRNIEKAVVDALRSRAATHGVSAEAEHRAILKEPLLRPPRGLKQHLLALPDVGHDADFDVPRPRAKRVRF
jgi:plasmid stability protein